MCLLHNIQTGSLGQIKSTLCTNGTLPLWRCSTTQETHSFTISLTKIWTLKTPTKDKTDPNLNQAAAISIITPSMLRDASCQFLDDSRLSCQQRLIRVLHRGQIVKAALMLSNLRPSPWVKTLGQRGRAMGEMLCVSQTARVLQHKELLVRTERANDSVLLF